MGFAISTMPTKIDDLYQCDTCLLLYNDEEWAQKCETWCNEMKSCNIAITSHSVNKQQLSLSEE